MRRLLLILVGLIIIPISGKAQENSNEKRDKSLTIAFAPTYFTLFDDEFIPGTFWPPSFYITTNIPIKNRLSLSTGIHFIYKKTEGEGFVISEWGYSGPTKSTNRISFYSIPIRLNYNILEPNSKFNLYAKAEITNSLIANYTKGSPDFMGTYGSHTEYGYDMFFGLGLGVDFRLSKKLSFVIEPGINYSLFGLLPEVGIADCQLGLKYNLIK
jgi:hypothetical protein